MTLLFHGMLSSLGGNDQQLTMNLIKIFWMKPKKCLSLMSKCLSNEKSNLTSCHSPHSQSSKLHQTTLTRGFHQQRGPCCSSSGTTFWDKSHSPTKGGKQGDNDEPEKTCIGKCKLPLTYFFNLLLKCKGISNCFSSNSWSFQAQPTQGLPFVHLYFIKRHLFYSRWGMLLA